MEATDASLMVKNIGKPCAGKLHARFDEGALRKYGLGTRSNRVRRGVSNIGRAGEPAESVLYSTTLELHTLKNADLDGGMKRPDRSGGQDLFVNRLIFFRSEDDKLFRKSKFGPTQQTESERRILIDPFNLQVDIGFFLNPA